MASPYFTGLDVDGGGLVDSTEHLENGRDSFHVSRAYDDHGEIVCSEFANVGLKSTPL